MIITALNIPVSQYALAKDAGINTVWGGDPVVCATAGLQSIPALPIKPNGEIAYDVLGHSSAVGFSLPEDIPIADLSAAQEAIQRLQNTSPRSVFPGLVSATYTRMLDYLGAESVEEYYRAFAELAPSAIPMLCHYPFHWMEEDEAQTPQGDIIEYERNLAMMQEVFPTWWGWVQVSAHSHYADADGNPEWIFDELDPAAVVFQVDKLVAAGCSGIGYFCWGPLKGDGIVGKDGKPSKHFSAIQAINRNPGN